MSHDDWSTPVVTIGVLGWGNRKHGCEAYGPGGRWHGGDGDLLGDALERAGAGEGMALVVVAVDRFAGPSVDDLRNAVAATVAEWHARARPRPDPAPLGPDEL